MRNRLWVGVLLLLLAFGAPAAAAGLVLDYPESSVLGDRVTFTLTSDVTLREATVRLLVGAAELPYRMSAVDANTFRVRFVPLASSPGPVRFYVTAVTESGEAMRLPEGAPGAASFEILILEDKTPPDFVFLNADQTVVAGQRASLAFVVPAAYGTVDPETVEVLVDGQPAEQVEAQKDFILAHHTFERAGRYTVVIRGADTWGNEGVRTFTVQVSGPRLVDTRFTLRTDGSAVIGDSAGVTSRLDGFARLGAISLNGHFTQALAGETPAQRYSLQAEWDPRGPFRLKGSLGSFAIQGTNLVVSTSFDQGLGVELDLPGLGIAYGTGVMNRATGTEAEIAAGSARYERNMTSVALRTGLGRLFTIGMNGVVVSDRYLGLCTLDADGCALPRRARTNLALGLETGLNLLGASVTGEVAASLDMPRITRAVPYTGGPLVIGEAGAEANTKITPSDFFPKERYERFSIPQFDIAELLDTANPAIVPGIALRTRLALPRILGVTSQVQYVLADSGFESLAAPGPSGEESLSLRLSANVGRRWQLTVRAEDSREVRANFLLGVLLEYASNWLDEEADDTDSTATPHERTQRVSANLRVPVGRLTLRPSVTHEIKGTQPYALGDTLWKNAPGVPLKAAERTSHKTTLGVRLEGLQVRGWRIGTGVSLTSAAGYAGGKAQKPELGNSLELDAQRGAYHARAAVEDDPLTDQRTNRLRFSWNGTTLSASVGWEQLYTSDKLTESKIDLGVSGYFPLGINSVLGAGVNFAIIDQPGGDSTQSGNIYAYHQISF